MGSGFVLALKEDGTVWSWGFNRYGVLGINTGPNQRLLDAPSPVRVAGLDGIIEIEAGFETAFAIGKDASLWAWGNLGEGMLGLGLLDPAWQNMSTPQPVPRKVPGLSQVKQVSAGTYHTLVLLADGRVVAFGSNQQGQLGNGTTENQWAPAEVAGLPPAVAAGARSSIAVLRDGTVRAWGSNASGILLNGGRQGSSPEPKPIAGITTAVDAKAGGGFFLVLLGDGTLRCWGHSAWGHCGDGKSGGYTLAITSPKVAGVQWYGAGFNSGFAKLADGRLVAWGAIYSEPMSDAARHTALPVPGPTTGGSVPEVGHEARLHGCCSCAC